MACRLAISRDRFCSAPAADPHTDQLRALQPQAHFGHQTSYVSSVLSGLVRRSGLACEVQERNCDMMTYLPVNMVNTPVSSKTLCYTARMHWSASRPGQAARLSSATSGATPPALRMSAMAAASADRLCSAPAARACLRAC